MLMKTQNIPASGVVLFQAYTYLFVAARWEWQESILKEVGYTETWERLVYCNEMIKEGGRHEGVYNPSLDNSSSNFL